MEEDTRNIGLAHPECAPRAKPELLEGKTLESFIGKFVKVAFAGIDPVSGRPRTEHMWVEVKSVEDGKFVGLLNNDPVLDHEPPLEDQSKVTVNPARIEDICE
jgi:uncharacterized protein YegJ (DUF2314 family)